MNYDECPSCGETGVHGCLGPKLKKSECWVCPKCKEQTNSLVRPDFYRILDENEKLRQIISFLEETAYFEKVSSLEGYVKLKTSLVRSTSYRLR